MQHQRPVELAAPRTSLRSMVPRAAAPSLEPTLVLPDDQRRLKLALMNVRIDRGTNTIVKQLGE